MVVIDSTDAYWNIPVVPRERRLFTTILWGKVYVILRATQGSNGGRLLWARTAAFISRLGQSLCPVRCLRINTYVDDPILAVSGSRATRDRCIVKVLLAWLALGFILAWHKAQRGRTATWTSAKLTILPTGVKAEIKDEIIQAVWSDAKRFRDLNVIPVKELRTFTGRVIHVASLLFAWLPFVRQLWAPLSPSAKPSGAPRGCVWGRQIRFSYRRAQQTLSFESA